MHPMECKRTAELACAAALGTLGGPELAEFERHAAECPDCCAELGRARGVLAALGSAPPPVPHDLADRIAAAGRAEIARLRRGRRLLKLLAPAAAAAAVLAISLRLWGPWAGGAGRGDGCECWSFVDRDAGNSRDARAGRGCVPRQVLWEARIEGPASAYKPLVWKRTVVVGTGATFRRRGGGLAAFDAESGKTLWSRDYPSGDFYKAKGFPDRCVRDGRLYVTDGERCIILDVATGREITCFAPPGGVKGWGYLSAQGQRLFGVARDGGAAFGVDASSGRILWKRRLAAPVFVPALSGDRLYVHTLDGGVEALDAASGSTVWRRDGATPGGKAWVYAHDDRVVVLSEGGLVTLLAAGGGEVAWSRRVEGAFASGLAVGDDAVYALAGCVALDAGDGRELWRKTGATSGICTPPTLADGYVLSAAGKAFGSLNVYTASGESLATLDDVAGGACDGIIVAGGKAYAVGGTRVLALACETPG
jgi:outer membrane protein assembly factor BamB